MNTDREDLIERYQQFSDEELLKLYTSGNLTDLAKSVSLREIKVRRLETPSVEFNSNKLFIDMKTIALNLSSSEVDELAEIIKLNGIPVLIDEVHPINNMPINKNLYQLSVSPMHMEVAMKIVNSRLNHVANVDKNSLMTQELKASLGNDGVNCNNEIPESMLNESKTQVVEANPPSTNSEGQSSKFYVVIIFFIIEWISQKFFDFSFVNYFH